MGAKVLYPEDNTADLLKVAIHDVKDINNIKIGNPYKDGRLTVYIEAMKYLIEHTANDGYSERNRVSKSMLSQ